MSAPAPCAQAPRATAGVRRAAILQVSQMTGTRDATLEVDLLLSHTTGHSRAHIFAFGEHALSTNQLARFYDLLRRRLQGEPVAYLLGYREFYGHRFHVTRDTLIPRPETELLVDVAHKFLRDAPSVHILDLGTGSGCLAITLAHGFPDSHAWAMDCCPRARAVAAANADRLGVGDRVAVLAHSFEDPFPAAVPDRVDVIVSNPPYLTEAEYDAAPVDVRAYEPRAALQGGDDGLRWYPTLIHHGIVSLRSGGWLILEIGASQGATVSRMFSDDAWGEVCVRRDLGGRERVVCARRSA